MPLKIAREAFESIAFQIPEVIQALEAGSGIIIKELSVDGGATDNNLLMFMGQTIAATGTCTTK